jgi:excisionase family DNA binding protein
MLDRSIAGGQMRALPDRLLFPFEVAKYYGVTMQTVYIWIRKKKITAIRTPGGNIRIQPESVAKFEQERT